MTEPHKSFSVGWVDNGSVTSEFAVSLLRLFKTFNDNPFIHLENAFCNTGSVIAWNRHNLLKQFYAQNESDWLLMLDTDIVLEPNDFLKLFKSADKVLMPVVVGVYYLVKANGSNLPYTEPTIYKRNKDNPLAADAIYDAPENTLIKIDRAGLGCVLLHKSVVKRLIDKFGNINFFAEEYTEDGELIGEDFVFFDKIGEANIPIHAHTGVVPTHIKKLPIDARYHKIFWSTHRKLSPDE